MMIELFPLSFLIFNQCLLAVLGLPPGDLWLFLSHSLTTLACYTIAVTALYLVKHRQDLPFKRVFWLLSIFMVAGGTAYLLELWPLWDLALLKGLKAVTALIATYLAIVLLRLVPQALALPSPKQLRLINDELQQQIHDRQQAEAQVQQLNQDLEAKVAQRTNELEDSMIQVQEYVERATLAMDAARMGAWDWDLTNQKIVWSFYHTILLGCEDHNLVRTYEDWRQRVHPDDLAAVEAAVQTARATGTDFSAEYRVVWDDGSVHWVAAFGRFYFGRLGEPLRMAGMMQDITDRKQVEAALQLSEERLRLATEAAEMGMWFWQIDTNELVWTPKCKALFGLKPETEMSYDAFLAALHPDDRNRADAAVQQALVQQAEYVIEFRSQWPDGSEHWVVSKGRAFYDEQGQPVRMMGIAQDISDRKKIEFDLQERSRELNQMNRMLLQTTALINQRNQALDQFAHVVSHDLKAPLRAIANLSEWIEEDLTEHAPPDTKQNLELLRSRVRRMDTLISGLLAYARIEHQAAPAETFALNELLDEIIDSLDVPPAFTLQRPPELPPITTNRLLLGQVFTNLISNAIKHHDRPNGRVQITARVLPHGYEFSVTDDGPGIAPRNHDRVFEIFQTLTSRDQKENTGIGLAIVKKIIERAGGQIHLESQIGQGSTFRFTWFNPPMI
jgi:PAS domain S-box-containing protein